MHIFVVFLCETFPVKKTDLKSDKYVKIEPIQVLLKGMENMEKYEENYILLFFQ